MHEGGVTTDPDGDTGIIVPQDIQTRINELMRTLNDLSQYIRVERVNTLSGSRVLEKDEDMVPFAVVDEYGRSRKLTIQSLHQLLTSSLNGLVFYL